MNGLSDGASSQGESSDERPRRTRFTILGLMIAVAVLAILLAAVEELRGVELVLALTFLALLVVQFVLLQDQRQIASIGFWVLAVFANVLYAIACTAPSSTYFAILFLGWLVIVMPAIIGLGMSWANGLTRGKSIPKRTGHPAMLSVIFLALLPVVTLLTYWPLHLAFLIARPRLDRLANRVDAGSAVAPVRVGLFRIVGSDVDPLTGNVGLIINPARHGRTGLVRIRPGSPPIPRGPIAGSDQDVPLSGGWRYRQGD